MSLFGASGMGNEQAIFESVYRGRQGALHHMAYMRMGKVLLALRALERAGVSLAERDVFDYGFGAGTFFRYCPRSSRLFGVEQDPQTVEAVAAMLRRRGYASVDLRPIRIDDWRRHPLLARAYGVFLCSHVLEHLPDPADFLRAVRGCIAPGGCFVGLVPVNERAANPHHLHAPNRPMIEGWARDAGYTMRWYEENDPFLYWPQPLYAVDSGLRHKVAQAFSLGLGVPATLLGHRAWFAVGKAFAALTASQPAQAAFVLEA